MATKKTVKTAKVEWQGYLNVNLTDGQDKDFDLWWPKQTMQLSDFDILLNNGYKIGLSWDKYHDGVTASLTANDAKLPRAGWVLTAWADSVESALLLLFYKHYIICEEDWEQFAGVVEKTGRKRG